jgi:nucleotide-binding universal stress UspA family protein
MIRVENPERAPIMRKNFSALKKGPPLKTLICIDGGANALKATAMAAKLSYGKTGNTTFLYVRRFRRITRGYNIRQKSEEIFAEWDERLPEIGYLHDAEAVFKKETEIKKGEPEMGENRKALVQLGRGVFEEGRVRLRSKSEAHLKIREGAPDEEILKEVKEGKYELIMMGARRAGVCRWFDIEHIPLAVARKADCPVMIVNEEFKERQPVLLCVKKKDPPEPGLDLVRMFAAKMKSRVEVLTVLKSPDPAFQFSEKIVSLPARWSKDALKVSLNLLIGKPAEVILDQASDCGLVVCLSSEKAKRKRLGRVTKKLICNPFNLLVLR